MTEVVEPDATKPSCLYLVIDAMVYALTDLAEGRSRRKRRMATRSRSENRARAVQAAKGNEPMVV